MRPARRVALAVQRASRAAHIPPDAVLRRWARAALAREAVVTVRYVAETEGRRLNRAFRGRDYATNVLTFAYGSRPLSGDIVVCAPVGAREARAPGKPVAPPHPRSPATPAGLAPEAGAQGKPVAAHHAHLLVHGLLPLAGLDRRGGAEAARMEARERRILAALGFPDPYAPVTKASGRL